jgi:hypothetical protein
LGSKNGSKRLLTRVRALRPLSPPRRITKQRPAAAKLRSWRVVIIRSKGEHLGTVEAPDRERTEAAAIKQFALDGDQRRQLLIRERL